MTSSAQLEREAEEARSQLARTLDELRERITPGQLMDQVVDYAKGSGGGEFARNFGRQVSANPLPVCVMAAGMAWLMLSNRRAPVTGEARFRTTASDLRERAAGTAENMVDAADDAAGRTRETAESNIHDFTARARDAGASVSEGVSSAYAAGREQAAAVGGAVADGYDRMADAASRTGSRIAEGTSSMTRGTAQATRNLLQSCADQPLLLAGLGLAIGAMIGAALPETEAEDRLMGESSDKLKGRAQEFAEEQSAKGREAVRSAAQGAAQAVKETAHDAAEEMAEPPTHAEPSDAEVPLVPEVGERETEGAPEEAAEQRHGLAE